MVRSVQCLSSRFIGSVQGFIISFLISLPSAYFCVILYPSLYLSYVYSWGTVEIWTIIAVVSGPFSSAKGKNRTHRKHLNMNFLANLNPAPNSIGA